MTRRSDRRGVAWRAAGPVAWFALAGACGAPAVAEVAARCTVTLDSGGVDLRGDSAITRGEPGRRFARDSRGNFYGAALRGGEVLQWSPAGRLERVIGRRGEGPGELLAGDLGVFVAPGDSLYVRDARLRWVVFDPAFRFVRNAPVGPIVPMSPGETHFLPGGAVASSWPHEGRSRATFAVVDRTGNLLHEAGRRSAERERDLAAARPSAYVGDGRVWIGPAAGPAEGYRIEIRDSTGRLVDSLRRDVPWFRADPDYLHQGRGHDHRARRPFPYPMIGRIVADGEGLVWVWTAVPKGPRAKRVFTEAPVARITEVVREVIEFRVEVFDARTKALIGAGTLPVGDHVTGAPLFNSRLMARIVEDDSARRVRIVSLRLRDADGRPCAAAPSAPGATVTLARPGR